MPCVHCGEILHTGEARVLVPFSLPELVDLAYNAPDRAVRERLIKAVGLLDAEREAQLWNDTKEL